MGVSFSFYNFSGLVDLQRGIAERLNEQRLEAFSILYCDFSGFDKAKIANSLEQVIRSSDAYVHNDNAYFFILYQTDLYGASVVATMFEEFFGSSVKHEAVSFPKDGETAQELFDAIQANAKKHHDIDLECLDHSSHQMPSLNP